MEISLETVEKLASPHFPGRRIIRVEDRGVWIRHNFKITFDSNEVVFLKIDLDPSSSESEKEAFICSLLAEHQLPAPPVVACDASRTIFPNAYILQKFINGIRLDQLNAGETKEERTAIYRALGKFYRRLHDIHHPHSGWIGGPGIVYSRSPNEHQFEEVILRIGGEAVEKGFLSAQDHQRLQRLWQENLAWLDQHRPSLLGGALPWTVYLSKIDAAWQVTKLMDLEDVLYWDPAWDIMNIRYPAFGQPLEPDLWEAFRKEYGDTPEEKRIRLYHLVQQLDAAMGNYLEPASPENERWKARVWQTFPELLGEAERAQC